METFAAVVEAGSFSRAAASSGVTAVMLGRRISQLEARLGGALLERSTRGLAVTAAGAAYHRRCLETLGQLDNAERLVRSGRDYATGHLTISCPTSFGRNHVVPNLAGFMQANPDLRISLNLSDRIVDLVRSGYEIGRASCRERV